VSRKIIGATHKSDANHDQETIDAREQGLRILARIIVRKHLRDMSFKEDNGHAVPRETEVSGQGRNYLGKHRQRRRGQHQCSRDSPSDDSVDKALSKHEEDSGEDLS
jgi:hypothetical protein